MSMLHCQTCVLQRGLTELTLCPVLWDDCTNVPTGGLSLLFVLKIFQPNSWTSPQTEENTSPSLKAHSTPVTAAEVTMEKNSSVWESTAVNLSLQFIIRNKEEFKRPRCFLGSLSPPLLPAPVPPNCSLIFAGYLWNTPTNGYSWVTQIYFSYV